MNGFIGYCHINICTVPLWWLLLCSGATLNDWIFIYLFHIFFLVYFRCWSTAALGCRWKWWVLCWVSLLTTTQSALSTSSRCLSRERYLITAQYMISCASLLHFLTQLEFSSLGLFWNIDRYINYLIPHECIDFMLGFCIEDGFPSFIHAL